MKTKKFIKKMLSAVLVLTIIVSSLALSGMITYAADVDKPTSLEDSEISIWADPLNILSQEAINSFNSDKLSTLGGIKPYKIAASGSIYYWFFPSHADLSQLRVWIKNGRTLSIDGANITSGQTISSFECINEGGISTDISVVYTNTQTGNVYNYTIRAIKSGNVGTIYIDTQSGSLSTVSSSSDHSTWESGAILVVQPDGTVDYMGEMTKFSGRGNGTWSTGNKKNPYNFKLATSASLLGLPSAKKWCLLANSGDSSLIKNQLTYDFADYIGVKYQPHCKPCDLYVNQMYLGSYQLAEKVQIKSNRINITDAYENLELANGTPDAETGAIVPADLSNSTIINDTSQSNPTGNFSNDTVKGTFGQTVGSKRYSNLTDPDDVTGGYLYELEITLRWPDNPAGFAGYNRQGWVLKNCDAASKSMVDYSYDLLYALGSAVYNGGTVPTTSTTQPGGAYKLLNRVISYPSSTQPAPAAEYQNKKWSDILDADSAVKYYWTQEFFKNMDSSTSSTYFYKDSDAVDSKVYAGPLWDMDNSIGYNSNGSRWGLSWTSAEGWYTKSALMYRYVANVSNTDFSESNGVPLNFYAALATNCSDFWSMAQKYWYNRISPAVNVLLGTATDSKGVLRSTAQYTAAIQKSATMNNYRFGNESAYNATSVATSINSWVSDRQTWINSQFPKTDISTATIGTILGQPYTGSEVKPSLNVTRYISGTGTETLEEGTDYTVTYTNNIDAGTATATINGMGIYEGSQSKTFHITKSSIASGYTLTIPTTAYATTEITAYLTNDSTGAQISGGVTYQWYRDGSAIASATAQSYLLTDDDMGAQITVVATGDGTNLLESVTSNTCQISSGNKPQGYQRSIASWDYDLLNNADALVNADTTGTTYFYAATDGEKQDSATLYASVNATDRAVIKSSGTSDLYANDGVSAPAPVMGTSKTDKLAWGQWGYFETAVSTLGYEDIHFSAKLGGTKKAPRSWKLQYSLDGSTYTDVTNASYTITANKTMEQAFDSVTLPDACTNQPTVYIRMVICEDAAINGTDRILNITSGDAAVNNIHITGASLSVITSLEAPTISPDGTGLFSDTNVTVTDNNGGADVYYSVNGGSYQLYSGGFNPFSVKTAKLGDTATVSAYSYFNEIQSETVTKTFTFSGVDINSFSYSTYSLDVLDGRVPSTGGTYGESGRMTAYTDGSSQYVPLWRDDNGAFSVSPDDGAVWSDESGFTFRVSTAGYENITFSAKSYTTAQGPASATLQYSTDGTNYYNVSSNVTLPANKTLEQVFDSVSLPAACDNKREIYIRLITAENLCNNGDSLWSNGSKGNFYINDVVVAGEDNGDYKMPYTEKATNYFGDNGTVKYISPDGVAMQYIVKDSSDNIVKSGTYPENGIQLSTVRGFEKISSSPYTVIIQAAEDEDTSISNIATYYYKGSNVVKFNYNDSDKLFSNFIASDGKSIANTSGTNAGTLAMYPTADSTAPATLSYTNTYGIKVSKPSDAQFATKKNNLDNPSGRGYWLITTSTVGYSSLTLTLEQLSSNLGPRDWGIAYSTNGSSYTYVANSNARAVSNDASLSTIDTYNNIPLPAACDNQQTLYIKVFINGGETVNGEELDDALNVTKGNTGINTIELTGIANPVTVSFRTTVLETPDATTGTLGFADADVYVNGNLKGTTGNNGYINLQLAPDTDSTVTVKGYGVVERTVTVNPSNGTSVSTPLLVFEVNDDGIINAKDFAIINKSAKYDTSKQYFANFINTDVDSFEYK